jgi:hypothetical protein
MKLLTRMAICILALCGQLANAQEAKHTKDYPGELKTLTAEYQKAEEAFYAPYRTAKTEAEREAVKLDYDKNPAKQYVSKFQALAKRAQGTETGCRALLWIARFGQDQTTRANVLALEELVKSYVSSPQMEEAVQDIRFASWQLGNDKTLAMLRHVNEASANKNVKAAALFSLGTVILEGRTFSSDKKSEAKKLFAQLKSNYPASRYAKMADSSIFELEHLQIGMKAPDFEATDQDGKAFKLSDYRGKVVVLDFWGFW